ncbi:MAG: hypothetical protein AAFQ87_26160, partial [Bacteroidota bacterium]
IDLSQPANMGLLIDKADGSFSSPTLLSGNLSITDSVLTISNVDLEAGDWFTICTGICPPGGWVSYLSVAECDPANFREDTLTLISSQGCDSLVITAYGLADSSQCSPGQISCNLSVWLDAGSGIGLNAGAVQSWNDKGPNGINASTVAATNRPVLGNTINGYPTVAFDGSNDWMKLNGATSALNGNCAIFAVFVPLADNDDGYYLSNHLGGSNRMKFGHRPNGELIYDDDSPSLALGSWLNQETMVSFNVTLNSLVKGWVNGTAAADWTSFSSSGSDRVSIGQEYDGSGNDNQTSNHWEGELAEMIIFDSQLSDDHRHRVETYLSLKYGLDIPVSSHLYYDHTGYPNNLVGIGKDATQCLDHQESRNVMEGSVLRISNPDDLGENEYWVAGHDGGSVLAADQSNNVNSFFYNHRLQRIWRVQQTGDPGKVELRFDLGSAGWDLEARSWSLIGNTSNDFSTFTRFFQADRLEGTELVFEDVDLNDGMYFTLAQFEYITVDLDVLLSGAYNAGA